MRYSATNTADQTEQSDDADTTVHRGIPIWIPATIGGALVIIAGVIIAIIAVARRNRSNRPPTPPTAGYPMQPYPPYVSGSQSRYGQA